MSKVRERGVSKLMGGGGRESWGERRVSEWRERVSGKRERLGDE